MIQIQILVSDLHRVHLGSYDVFWGQQVLANNSRLKRARDMGAFSLCLYCHDASIDMPHDLFGSAFDLRWPWPEVKYWHDLFTVTILWFDAPWREEYADTLIKPLAFLVQKLFAKNDVGKNSYFGVFWSLARKQLVLAQIWWHASGRTAQELSNVVFLGLLTKIVSEIMAHFRRNIEFSLNLTFDDLWWPQYWPERKTYWDSFEMIFDELSNAHFRFVLRRLGAELDGGEGVSRPPAPRPATEVSEHRPDVG